MRGLAAVSAAIAATTLLAACVVVPRTETTYDEKCQVFARSVTLEASTARQIVNVGCIDKGCAMYLATLGIVSAASVVVSGSIAIVGNVVYWLEKQGRCLRGSDDGDA